MECLASIRAAIDDMEEHLTDNIRAQNAADRVYLSQFFLLQGFSLMTGYGVRVYKISVSNFRTPVYKCKTQVSKWSKAASACALVNKTWTQGATKRTGRLKNLHTTTFFTILLGGKVIEGIGRALLIEEDP